jgi:phosphoglycolate phosphatase-like HAD superfamily hydrolase
VSKPRAIIVDVDGTLVDVTSIRHLVWDGDPNYRGYRDFKAFHMASAWCPPIAATVAAVRDHHATGDTILVVTARGEEWRALTETWLDEAEVPRAGVWMRPTGDGRPDGIVKAEILAKLRAEYDIVHAYDDNPNVIAVWTEHGIPTTVIPGWPTQENQ